jgi:23S rRNA pseudouridine2605 synthase
LIYDKGRRGAPLSLERSTKHSRHSPRHTKSAQPSADARFGLARVLSKRGVCSRTQAEAMVRAGRVCVNGELVTDPEMRTASDARIVIDEVSAKDQTRHYLMLNKPRGLVTTARDERGRATVYQCFSGAELSWIAPVGRLDQASEGLLLFSNDSEWAARLMAPESHLDKTYHVQIDCLPDQALLHALRTGVYCNGEWLAAKGVRELRRGQKNAWLEIVLDEGRNRQIRRLLSGLGVNVLRLIRVAIGELQLGDLPKGQWRELDVQEADTLVAAAKRKLQK